MTRLGQRNKLRVLRETPQGLYLEGAPLGDILLPRRYIPATGAVAGDELDVFVYLDSEDRLVATTETPLAMVGEFACLKVLSVSNRAGAFLDWGLSKDLLLPFAEQTRPVAPHDLVVVYVEVDERTNRIVASMRLNRFLQRQAPGYPIGQQVSLLVTGRAPHAYNVIVANAHRGLVYLNETPAPLVTGQRLAGFVRKLRTDGWVEVSLGAARAQSVAPLRVQLLQALRQNQGRLALDDASSPEEIRERFGVSKNAFKQALATLYRQRKIRFTRPGIELVGTKETGR